jgi:hypothetical protein
MKLTVIVSGFSWMGAKKYKIQIIRNCCDLNLLETSDTVDMIRVYSLNAL